MEQMTMKWDNISPIDTRYFNKILAPFLSENAFTKAKLKVECALATALSNRGICAAEVSDEIITACSHERLKKSMLKKRSQGTIFGQW